MLRKYKMLSISIEALVAEFVGTLLFTFFGSSEPAGAEGNGLLLAVLVYITAPMSGGHLNPAVTIALTIVRRVPVKTALAYIGVQLLGGIVGAGMINGLTDNKFPGCFVAQEVGDGFYASNWQLFGWEFMMVFLLVSTVMCMAIHTRAEKFEAVAPLIIGFSLWAVAGSGALYTGSSVNPARTLGPMIANGSNAKCDWSVVPFYVFGEILGGIAAAIFCYVAFLRGDDEHLKKVEGGQTQLRDEEPGTELLNNE